MKKIICTLLILQLSIPIQVRAEEPAAPQVSRYSSDEIFDRFQGWIELQTKSTQELTATEKKAIELVGKNALIHQGALSLASQTAQLSHFDFNLLTQDKLSDLYIHEPKKRPYIESFIQDYLMREDSPQPEIKELVEEINHRERILNKKYFTELDFLDPWFDKAMIVGSILFGLYALKGGYQGLKTVGEVAKPTPLSEGQTRTRLSSVTRLIKKTSYLLQSPFRWSKAVPARTHQAFSYRVVKAVHVNGKPSLFLESGKPITVERTPEGALMGKNSGLRQILSRGKRLLYQGGSSKKMTINGKEGLLLEGGSWVKPGRFQKLSQVNGIYLVPTRAGNSYTFWLIAITSAAELMETLVKAYSSHKNNPLTYIQSLQETQIIPVLQETVSSTLRHLNPLLKCFKEEMNVNELFERNASQAEEKITPLNEAEQTIIDQNLPQDWKTLFENPEPVDLEQLFQDDYYQNVDCKKLINQPISFIKSYVEFIRIKVLLNSVEKQLQNIESSSVISTQQRHHLETIKRDFNYVKNITEGIQTPQTSITGLQYYFNFLKTIGHSVFLENHSIELPDIPVIGLDQSSFSEEDLDKIDKLFDHDHDDQEADDK